MIQLNHIHSKNVALQISRWQFNLEVYCSIQDKSVRYIACVTIAVKKGFRK